jgi:hypothetical protein
MAIRAMAKEMPAWAKNATVLRLLLGVLVMTRTLAVAADPLHRVPYPSLLSTSTQVRAQS